MIILASDHAGFELKEKVKAYLTEKGLEVDDVGPGGFDPNDDYPTYIHQAALKVVSGQGNRGLIFGHSGQGEAIAANKTHGVRAIVYYGGNHEIITLSRLHNDANILSLGAAFLTSDQANEAVSLWLTTPFSGEERHVRRLNEIMQIEGNS